MLGQQTRVGLSIRQNNAFLIDVGLSIRQNNAFHSIQFLIDDDAEAAKETAKAWGDQVVSLTKVQKSPLNT